jgi:ribonuclease Z
MTIDITFLGTSSMVPTKQRNVQSIHLQYKSETILIDCGEGTQRQMNIAGLNRLKVQKVLISHWHGDHVSGLIGLIQTMSEINKGFTLHVYGPKGSKEKMGHLLKSCYFALRIGVKVHELDPKGVDTFLENEEYKLECVKLNHSIPCLGYNFILKDKIRIDMKKVKTLGLKEGKWLQKIQNNKTVKVQGKEIKPKQISFIEPSKKISFVLDTCFTKNAVKLSMNANLLISESVYTNEFQELATKYKHMTAKDAATIAKYAKVKKLILTHFSQRYKNTKELISDAKKVFKNSGAAKDFMKVKI